MSWHEACPARARMVPATRVACNGAREDDPANGRSLPQATSPQYLTAAMYPALPLWREGAAGTGSTALSGAPGLARHRSTPGIRRAHARPTTIPAREGRIDPTESGRCPATGRPGHGRERSTASSSRQERLPTRLTAHDANRFGADDPAPRVHRPGSSRDAARTPRTPRGSSGSREWPRTPVSHLPPQLR